MTAMRRKDSYVMVKLGAFITAGWAVFTPACKSIPGTGEMALTQNWETEESFACGQEKRKRERLLSNA